MTDEPRNYRGRGQGNGLPAGSGDLRADEQAVLDALRVTEQTQRPGLLVLYYNGTNWMLYDNTLPKWLPRKG